MSNFVRSRGPTTWSRLAGIAGFVGVLILATAIGGGAITTEDELDNTIEQQPSNIARCDDAVSTGEVELKLDSGTRAFIAREGAAVGSALDQAARTLARNPVGVSVLDTVLRATQPLRGIASLSDLPPLPDLLDGVGLIWAPVNRVEEAIDDPQARATGCFYEMEHPEAGPFETVGPPFRIEGTTLGARRGAPPLHADTREILREAGLAENEIEKLV